MGFFTQLGDLWGSGANYGFSKSWDLLGDAWGKTKDSAKTFASGVWGLATSPFDDKRSVMDAFLNLNYSFADASKQLGEAGLGLFGAATEVPVVKQMFGTAGFIQNEFVKRPLGTGFLMAGDVGLGKTSWFDKQAWVQAYNDTRYVSTGQAAVYSAFNSSDIGRQTPELDPRSQESQEAYRSNAQLKYASGTADAAVDVFADPTVYGGKALAALKLRYISRPLRTAAQVDRYVDSANYTRLREYVRQAPNPEALRQEVFTSHRGGDKAAALLSHVRNDDDLFDATFNSLYGDKEAWAYLIENAPRIAQVTGRIYANQTIARAVDEAGISARSTGTVDALRETESQAFVDAIANGNGAWGAGHGALIGQSAPRLTVTSKWRAGVHNWLTFGPQVFRGSPIFPVASRARYVLPSARFTRFMDVNDLNSVGAFRANLERAPLSREQVEDFVSQYGRASSPESRARIAGDAEDAAFREMAAAHGFTTADVENALPAINRWRTASRQMFSSSRRFMSRDVMNLYEQYTGAGREREADNAFFLNGEMEDAVRRGDQPADVYWMLDEDGNNVMIPGRFNVDPARPVTLSQRADIVAMQDWRSLDSALWWTRNGPLGGVKRSAYTVINGGSALLDAVNTVWKVTSLLRPGYLWRMLSDDVMRRAALIGAAPVAMSTAQGLARAGVNAARRGGLVVDAASAYRQRRGLDPVDRLEADVEDDNGIVGAIGGSDPLTREPLGGPYAPAEDAVAMSTGTHSFALPSRRRRAVRGSRRRIFAGSLASVMLSLTG